MTSAPCSGHEHHVQAALAALLVYRDRSSSIRVRSMSGPLAHGKEDRRHRSSPCTFSRFLTNYRFRDLLSEEAINNLDPADRHSIEQVFDERLLGPD